MEDLSPHDQVIIDKILNMEEESQEALITSPQQQQFKTEGANSLQLCSENQVSTNNVQIINNTPTCSTSNTVASLDIQTTNNSGLPKDLRHLKMDGFSDLVNDQDNKPVVSEVTVSFVYCNPSNQPQHVYTSPSQISPVQMSQGDNILCTTSPSSNPTSIQTLLEQQKQIQNNLHIMSQRQPSEAPLLTFVNTTQSESSFKTPLTITTTDHNNTLSINQNQISTTSDPEQNMESDANVLQNQNDKSMLHQLLTSPDGYLTGSTDFNNASSPETASSPDYHPADSPSSLSSPASIVQHDPNTQATLIVNAGRLHLDSESGNEEISFHGLWQETMHGDEEPSKVGQTQIDTEQPSVIVAPAVDKVFDPDGVNSTFTFTMFGSDQQAFFGTDRKQENTAAGVKTIPENVSSLDGEKERHEMPPPKSIPTTRSQTHSKRVKEPSLNQHFPWKVHGYELRILDQPEEQHRARYLTEGSRGAVKNRSQEGHPVVKLFGPAESAVLQVFIGNDSGKVKPHGFYQACKVCGKNSTPAREKDIDGTTVIEMDLTPVSDMSASVDNVGILKLRNADVEQRIGLTKAKKKSVKARMIFRAVFRKADGNMQTLQIASNSILCTQPIGQPEVCKMSRSECSAAGKGELFLIGKNFMKGTKVFFQEVKEENETIWEKEAEIDKDYFQPTHLICTIPPYKDVSITSPVNVQIIVQSSGKMGDPQNFTYLPDTGKQETPMETQEVSQKRKLSFSVSPEALELNQQIQHTSGMFQLPPGTISTASMTGVTNMQVDSMVSISASMDKDIKPVSPVLDNTKPTFSLDESETDSKPLNVMTSIAYDTKPIHINGIGGIPSVVPASSMEQGVLSVNHNFQQTKRCTSPIKQNTSCSAALLQAVEEMKSLQRSTAVQQNLEQELHRQQSNPDLQQHFLTPQAVEMTGVQEALLNHLAGNKFLQQQELQQLPQQQQQPMVVSSIPQLPILREHLTSDIQNMASSMSGVKTEIPMAVISPSSVSATKETLTGAFTSLQAMTSSPMTVQSSMGTQQIMTSGSQSPMATILPSSLAFSQFTQTQQVVSHVEQPKDVKPAVSMATSVMSSSGAFAPPVSGQASRPQQVPVPQIIICGGAGQANNLNGIVPQPTLQTIQPPQPQVQQPPQPQVQPPPQPTVQQQSQQPAPLGPSIFILPGGGAGGANAQVENLLRSILGSLQPTQQPQS